MDNNWKQDPRLMAMDPEKVSLLMEFAEKTAQKPDTVATYVRFCIYARKQMQKVCNLQILKPPFL